jgi:hypothetical protein
MPIDETKVMAAVGGPVKFSYPVPAPTQRGRLTRRKIAWNDVEPRIGGAFYCDVVDIIEFGGHDEPRLRIGYYRLSPADEKLRWASQTTICEPLSIWRQMLPVIIEMMEKAKKMAG